MNQLRMLLQVWDEELATVAQRWADKCTLAHDGARDVCEYRWITYLLHLQHLSETLRNSYMCETVGQK
jgi:hypothetical protein